MEHTHTHEYSDYYYYYYKINNQCSESFLYDRVLNIIGKYVNIVRPDKTLHKSRFVQPQDERLFWSDVNSKANILSNNMRTP